MRVLFLSNQIIENIPEKYTSWAYKWSERDRESIEICVVRNTEMREVWVIVRNIDSEISGEN